MNLKQIKLITFRRILVVFLISIFNLIFGQAVCSNPNLVKPVSYSNSFIGGSSAGGFDFNYKDNANKTILRWNYSGSSAYQRSSGVSVSNCMSTILPVVLHANYPSGTVTTGTDVTSDTNLSFGDYKQIDIAFFLIRHDIGNYQLNLTGFSSYATAEIICKGGNVFTTVNSSNVVLRAGQTGASTNFPVCAIVRFKAKDPKVGLSGKTAKLQLNSKA